MNQRLVVVHTRMNQRLVVFLLIEGAELLLAVDIKPIMVFPLSDHDFLVRGLFSKDDLVPKLPLFPV